MAGLAVVMSLTPSAGLAQAEKVMSAAESDPVRLGWMVGSPPSPEKIIRFSDPDYFTFPKLRWTVCHFRQLMPTLAVSRGFGAPGDLPRRLDASLDAVSFNPLGGGAPMTWGQAFDVNYSDGVVVLHKGVIV